MGLDITAYKKLHIVKEPKYDKWGDLDDAQWIAGTSMDWSESIWEGRGEGVDSKTIYEFADSFDFRAGSYSGYNWWRSMLEEFKGSVAFQELINFADNEGVIGSIVSAKLLKDFEDNMQDAVKFSKTIGDGDYWLEQYNNWAKAFMYASNNGAVDFH